MIIVQSNFLTFGWRLLNLVFSCMSLFGLGIITGNKRQLRLCQKLFATIALLSCVRMYVCVSVCVCVHVVAFCTFWAVFSVLIIRCHHNFEALVPLKPSHIHTQPMKRQLQRDFGLLSKNHSPNLYVYMRACLCAQ